VVAHGCDRKKLDFHGFPEKCESLQNSGTPDPDFWGGIGQERN